MPLFDYECPECGKVITDHPLVWCDCPACVIAMWKLPSAPALAFKGDGWTPKHFGGKS